MPRNVLPHPLPIGHIPSHLLCLGMLGHAGHAQLDAALGMPHRTPVVSESQCGPSSPQHAKGSPLVACEWSEWTLILPPLGLFSITCCSWALSSII